MTRPLRRRDKSIRRHASHRLQEPRRPLGIEQLEDRDQCGEVLTLAVAAGFVIANNGNAEPEPVHTDPTTQQVEIGPFEAGVSRDAKSDIERGGAQFLDILGDAFYEDSPTDSAYGASRHRDLLAVDDVVANDVSASVIDAGSSIVNAVFEEELIDAPTSGSGPTHGQIEPLYLNSPSSSSGSTHLAGYTPWNPALASAVSSSADFGDSSFGLPEPIFANQLALTGFGLSPITASAGSPPLAGESEGVSSSSTASASAATAGATGSSLIIAGAPSSSATLSTSSTTATSSPSSLLGGGGIGGGGFGGLELSNFSYGGGSQLLTSGADVYVIEWNDGITLSTSAIEFDSERDFVDLRAQVAGKEVATYDWDFSEAATATNVAGDNTYNVTFTWGLVDEVPEMEVINDITLTIVYTDESEDLLTYRFVVVDTGVPGGGPGGSSAVRDMVTTPDRMRPYELPLYDGAFTTAHGMPGLSIEYNSENAVNKPIFLARYELDPAEDVPATIKARLTLDEDVGDWVFYDTSEMNPGDIVQIALQGDATALATGRYGWEIEVVADYGSGDVTTSEDGVISIVNRASGPLGLGWSIQGLTKLYEVADGVILDEGTTHIFFEWDDIADEFIAPPGDFSTLVKNIDDTFTRTLKSGILVQYDEDGFQTQIEDRNGNTVDFAYTSGALTLITDPTGRDTVLAYTSGKLTSVTDPAERETTFGYTSGALTLITDPDETTIGFDYTNGRLTEITDKRAKITTIAYGLGGRVSEISLPEEVTHSYLPYLTKGLAGSGEGTSLNPALAVLAAAATGEFIDGRNNGWRSHFDWTGLGKTASAVSPLDEWTVMHMDDNGMAKQFTNAAFTNTFYTRDADGDVTKIRHADHAVETFTYNAYGQTLTHTDTRNKTTTMTYDAYGNLEEIENALEQVTSFTYTGAGRVETVTDAAARTTTFVYDEFLRLEETIYADDTPLTEADNPRVTLEYDVADHVVRVVDQNSNETRYVYDELGRVTDVKLDDDTPEDWDDNPKWTMTYDNVGNRLTTTDPLANTVTTTYDDLNRPVIVEDQLGKNTFITYDAASNVIEIEDALAQVTTAEYDAAGRLISVTDAANKTIERAYNAVGQVITVTDPLENVTSIGYNQRGWTASVTDPVGNVMGYSYDGQGAVTAMGYAGGGGVYYDYDDLGRVVLVRDEDGVEMAYEYDDVGNLIAQEDEDGNRTEYEYDERNNVISITDALLNVTSYTYDLRGNVLTRTDPLNRTTTYEYDSWNRLIRTEDAEEGETFYEYDDGGRLLSLEDAMGNATSYTYDDAGRMLTETDALENVTSFAYDVIGQLISRTDRNGRIREFDYDPVGRLTAEIWKTGETTVRTISFEYDDDGNLLEAYDADSHYTYAYLDNGLVETVDNYGTSGMTNIILTYDYNVENRVTEITDNFSGDIDYTYTAAGRMATVTMTSAGSLTARKPEVTFGYNNLGQLSSLTRVDLNPEGGGGGGGGEGGGGGGGPQSATISTQFTYDDVGRVTDIWHYKDGPTTIHDMDFVWDDAGQLIQQTSSIDGTVYFDHDLTGQLIEVSGGRSEDYSYDLTGNRTMTNWDTTAGNQLESDGTFDYLYDDEGNMIKKTEISSGKYTEYTWDHRNRLTAVLEKSSSHTLLKESLFSYDVFDKRIKTSFDNDGAGSGSAVVTWTAYNGVDPYADFNGSGSLTTRYLHGPAVDAIMARVDSGGIDWYLTDHLGSVTDIVDSLGTVQDHIEYDSFGNIISESNPSNGDRFKFTGREYDATTGLYYYRARYYDPHTGRFLSMDPIGFEAGDPNVYRYVGNHPTIATDPTGLEEWFYPWQGRASWNPVTTIKLWASAANSVLSSGADYVAEHPAEAAITLASIVVEPLDWIVTAKEVWDDPLNMYSYAGFIPFVPAAAGKAGKKILSKAGRVAPVRALGKGDDVAGIQRLVPSEPIVPGKGSSEDLLPILNQTKCFPAGTLVLAADQSATSDEHMMDEAEESRLILASIALAVGAAGNFLAARKKPKRRSGAALELPGDHQEDDADQLWDGCGQDDECDDGRQFLVDQPPGAPVSERQPVNSSRLKSGLVWLALCALVAVFLAFSPEARQSRDFAAHDTFNAGDSPSHDLTWKKIEDVRPGDLVVAREEHGRKLALKPVKQIFRRTRDDLRVVQVEHPNGSVGLIKTTDEHPFWVKGQGWVQAQNLEAGQVLGDSDQCAVVISTLSEPRPGGVAVYNFQVADYHTYFVRPHGSRAPPVLVHNSCGLEDIRLVQLAEEIARAGLPPSKQTVVVLDTAQGKKIVSAGGPDLTAGQKALARQKPEVVIADEMPKFHGEITGIAAAGDNGLLPTRGYTTNQMCADCYDQLQDLARQGGYELILGDNGKTFAFLEMGSK